MTKLTLKGKIFKFVLIVVAVFWFWLFIYAQKMDWEPKVDRVEYLNAFYQTSWYTQQREYKKDIEDLKREKQKVLDDLSYGASAIFYEKWQYSLDYMSQEQQDRLVKIDDTIKLANDWIKNIPEPDYTQINKATPIQITKTTQEMDFINLLK
jgi:hypothetical protein